MNLLFDIFENISSKRKVKNSLSHVKGDFGEFLVYDYFEYLGYVPFICETRNKQRLEDGSIIPDILSMRSDEKFFIECKTNYVSKLADFSIDFDKWEEYLNFYNNYYPNNKGRVVAEKETQVAFVDVYDDCCVLWLIDFYSLSKFMQVKSKYDKEMACFDRKITEEKCERVVVEYECLENGKIKTPFCNDIFGKKREEKIFSIFDFME